MSGDVYAELLLNRGVGRREEWHVAGDEAPWRGARVRRAGGGKFWQAVNEVIFLRDPYVTTLRVIINRAKTTSLPLTRPLRAFLVPLRPGY